MQYRITKRNKKRCKWCGKLIEYQLLKQHEEECNMNDGGRSDMNYEDVADKYF